MRQPAGNQHNRDCRPSLQAVCLLGLRTSSAQTVTSGLQRGRTPSSAPAGSHVADLPAPMPLSGQARRTHIPCPSPACVRRLTSNGLFTRTTRRFAYTMMVATVMAVVCTIASYSAVAGETEPFPIRLPDGCHAEMRESFVYKSRPTIQAFESGGHLQSYDILCIGDTITIDHPLQSSGGVVVILARRLRLYAPIDTRPYFRRASVVHHAGLDAKPMQYESNTPGYAAYYTDFLRKHEVSATDVLGFEPVALGIANAYYLSCVDCIKDSSEVWMPELPSGITPPFVNWLLTNEMRAEIKGLIRNGIPPLTSELDRSAVRSGDLFAFVEAIEFAGDWPPPAESPDPLSCTDNRPVRLALIEVGGARGGRGGLGQPTSCIGDPVHRATGRVNCGYGFSGTNSPGGRGGDAGSVYLRIIGSGSIDVAPQVDLHGGPGGSTSRFVMPLSVGNSYDLCSIRSSGNLPRQPPGLDGTLSFKHITAGDAWSRVYKISLWLDGLMQHDVRQLAAEAVADDRIVTLSFRDFYRLSAQQRLQFAESKLAAQTLDFLRTSYGLPSKSGEKGFWSWSGTSIPVDLPEDVRTALSTVSQISISDPSLSITRFFREHDGLLSITTSDAQLDYHFRRIRETLERQAGLQAVIRSSIDSIDKRVTAIDQRAEVEKSRESVAEISRQINAARAKWQADLARFDSEWAKAGQSFLDGFTEMATLGLGAGAAKADLTPPFLKMGKALIQMDNIEPAVAPDLGELNKLLLNAEEELRRISIEASRQREVAQLRYAKSLVDALVGRANSRAELTNRSTLYPDLYKNAWLTFTLSPGRNRGQFQANIAALDDFSRGTAVPSDVQLKKLDLSGCAGVGQLSTGRVVGWQLVGTCVVIMPDAHRRILMGAIDGEVNLHTLKLPLLVIAPFTSGQRVVDVRGFSDLEVDTEQ